MTNKAFFLFPGQGAQYPGMALDLLEESAKSGGERVSRLFTLASKITRMDMIALLRDSSPETLKKTDISQPAITLANLAAAAFLSERGIDPMGCAGFSLGEYAAMAAAGVISEEDCFQLVTQRGKAMQAAIDKLSANADAPGMAAVLGLNPEKTESLIAEWKAANPQLYIYAANINSPKQCVVAGTAAALNECEKLFTAAGARRFIRLAVAGPFHSPLMQEAADKFRPHLEKVEFKDPVIPVFSNVSGKKLSSGREAKDLALAHITSPVRWVEEQSAIANEMAANAAALETGPGKVLQGLWKDAGILPPCYAAGTLAEIEELLQ